LYILQVDDV